MAARWFLFAVAVVPAFPQTYLVATAANRTHDSHLDWIGESIAETVREALAARGIPVVSRDDRQEAVKRLSLRPSSQLSLASVIKLAASVDAALVIHSEFELLREEGAGNQNSLRLTARVVECRSITQPAEFFESGALEDLAVVQSNLAWQILRWASPREAVSREEFRATHPPVKVSALESYLRGLMASNEEVKHRYLTQAARLDPSFTHPCFHLGRLQYDKENYREAASWLGKVNPRNPHYGSASFLLGLSLYELSNYEGARLAFERISGSSRTHELSNNLGVIYAQLGRPDALDYFRKALEADPKDADYHFNTGYSLWRRKEFEAATAHFRAVLDLAQQDEDAVLLLGRCLKGTGPRTGDWRSEGLERLKYTSGALP